MKIKVEIGSPRRARTIMQTEDSWDTWFDGEGVSDDFMTSREQPPQQEQRDLGPDNSGPN